LFFVGYVVCVKTKGELLNEKSSNSTDHTCFYLATTPYVLATDYEVEMIVPAGKRSKETDAVLKINEKDLEVIPDEQDLKQYTKKVNYADIKVADYSYAKKPMLSGGGAIATALLVGFIFAIPFLFIKKKNHWLSLQTEKEFAVVKLDGSNRLAIIAELETHGVNSPKLRTRKRKVGFLIIPLRRVGL
jgi:hypothetical protein